MGKARRIASTDHGNLRLKALWDRKHPPKWRVNQGNKAMQKDKIIETLARMWIECDPNRSGEKGSGFHADDPMTEMTGDLKDAPRWRWFIPRAEASLSYLKKHGLVIEPQRYEGMARP